MEAAETKVVYRKSITIGQKLIFRDIRIFLKQDDRINRARVFGSFALSEDRPDSDIDLMIEEKNEEKFSYFDLADIQYQLEKLLKRKVDIGFASALKEGIAKHIQKEAKLIYENRKGKK